MTKLTTGDLTELTDWSEKQIRNMCDAGVLIPEQDGDGPGCFRLFGITQSVGLYYASQWAAKGYSRELVAKVMLAVADLTEDELVAEFKKGRTHLIPRSDGTMTLSRWPKDIPGEVFDLKFIYDDLKAYIARKVEEGEAVAVNVRSGRGRRRGSQSST
ncbi:MAG: hypothetical protein WBC44_11595 [Planctomycetaceae bacterium]